MRPLLPSRPFPRRSPLPRLLRRLRRALAGLAAAGLAVGGLAVWFGTPYPAADPEASAARLKAEAGRVLEEARLPPGTRPVHNGVETGTCYHRGLRSLAHIDQGRPDVRSFELSWQVTGVPEKTAADAQERTRRRLTAAGWTRVPESGGERGVPLRASGLGRQGGRRLVGADGDVRRERVRAVRPAPRGFRPVPLDVGGVVPRGGGPAPTGTLRCRRDGSP